MYNNNIIHLSENINNKSEVIYIKHYKIGLLGFGNMGKTHLYAVDTLRFYYQKLPYTAEIAGVCTATEKSGKDAREFGIPFSTTNEDDLIYDPSIDIIDVSTPNLFHFETLKKAIAAGKHIYCEKPLCINNSQANEIASLMRGKNIKGQMVFHNRFIGPVVRAKQIIDEGHLGRLLSFRCSYLHSSATDTTRNAGWKQNSDICGGGTLVDLGSHAIDLVYHLCGRYESVNGMSQIAYPVRRGSDGGEWETNADEAFYMLAKMECGACGTLEASKIAVGTNDDFRIEIYGEHGSIRFSLMDPNFLEYYSTETHNGQNHNTDLGGFSGYTKIECVSRYPEPAYPICGVKAPVGWLRGHVGSYQSFLNCVHHDREPSPSLFDGAYNVEIIEAAYKSAREKLI